jgi:hypothetical protein
MLNLEYSSEGQGSATETTACRGRVDEFEKAVV